MSERLIIAIHQPSYWPWLGLLDKIAKSDILVLLDSVSANKDAYQYRNQFYCNGQPKMLTMPVNYRMNTTIKDLCFKNEAWTLDHLNKIRNYYLKSPYYNEIFPLLERYYNKTYSSPLVALLASIELSTELLGINTKTIMCSELSASGKKGTLVLNICKELDAKTYLSGTGAKEYLSDVNDEFAKNGIEIKYQSFRHPEYNQFGEHAFVAGLACVDMLFFCGIKETKEIFWRNIES